MLSDVAAAPMEMTLLGIQGKVLHHPASHSRYEYSVPHALSCF